MKGVYMKKILYAVISSLLLLSLLGCEKRSEQVATINSAPIETLDFNGFSKVVEAHKGKVVLVNFFGTWCPPCKAETPDFVEIYEQFKDKNFVIIGLAVDRDKADAVKFVNDYKITYPVYQASEELSRYFNVGPIPTSFLLDKDGNIRGSYIGQMSRDMVIKTAEMGGK